MTDYEARAALAARAARSGAAVAAAAFRTGIDVEEKAGKTDVVTQADRDAQREVVSTIREEYPEDAIVGEEEDELKQVPESGPAWVIDPIDGTNNFVAGVRYWTTSVAAVVDGEPVAAANVAPALDDEYLAGPPGALAGETGVERNGEPISVDPEDDRELLAAVPTIWWGFDRREEYAAACRAVVERFGDLRRFGCAQLALANVADGALAGTFTNVETNPWDTIAGVKLVRAAGGRVTDVHGDRWRHDSQGLVASNGALHQDVLEAAQAAEAVRTE